MAPPFFPRSSLGAAEQYSKCPDGAEDDEGLVPLSTRRSSLSERTAALAVRVVVAVGVLVLCGLALSFSGYEVRLVAVARLGREDEETAVKEKLKAPKLDLYEPAPTVKAPRPNVWAPISSQDNADVWAFLHEPVQGLNLTHPSVAQVTDNSVYWIDTLAPNKSAVLPFIDGRAPDGQPAKYARVVVFEGAREDPVAQEYMVGPLPVGAQTRLAKLDYLYNTAMGGAAPYNARGYDRARAAMEDAVIAEAMQPVNDILAALFDGAGFFGSGDERTTVRLSVGTPTSFDGRQGFLNGGFNFPGPATYALPIDFYVLVHWTGSDMRQWALRGYVTRTRLFATAAALRAAFEAGELDNDEVQQRRDYDWALVKYQAGLGERPLERRAAPQSLEVGGKRYRVDAEQQYVEYMGWSFYLTHTRPLGLMFYDIRFGGERVLYELSMQEAASQYAGRQPKAAGTLFHDTFYSFGAQLFPLVEGFDCPFGSTFWNVSFFEGNETVVHPQSVCLFEHDAGFPLSRHRAGNWRTEDGGEAGGAYGFENLGVVKGAALTVRFVATVGNYDYMFSYDFGQDGSLEVVVRASGYLMSSFYYPDQARFGPRVQQATQGSYHDHVINFKADFDIVDSANSFEITELRTVEQQQPWYPELGTFPQYEAAARLAPTEATFDWTANGQSMFCVVNGAQTNQWGQKRGYRVVPGRSNMHLSQARSPFSLRNSQFLKSDLAVTRQHDTEPLANSIHNVNLPLNPQQDFAKFLDGESIEQEDLVLWFNLGMHHFTRAEDIPVTLFTEAVSSIMFAPQNFFDRAQDGDLKNRRWMVADDDAHTFSYDDYGVPLAPFAVEFAEPATEMKKIQRTSP